MGKVVTIKGDSYVGVPPKEKRLSVSFGGSSSFVERYGLPLRLKKVSSDGVDVINGSWGRYHLGHDGASADYIVEHDLIHERVDPSMVLQLDSRGLERYLYSVGDIDSDNEVVLDVASDVRRGLSPTERGNPYLLGEAALDWVHRNLEYIIVPNFLINHVTSKISEQEGEPSVEYVLNHAFNFDDEQRVRLATKCSFGGAKTDREAAKNFMSSLNGEWNVFQGFWGQEGELSASYSISTKTGKCVGFSNAYVAIMRALGVPAMVMSGCAMGASDVPLGGHAWASVYIPGFGWKEADPTAGEYVNFSHDRHLHRLIEMTGEDLTFEFK
jgi:hypothetical protein